MNESKMGRSCNKYGFCGRPEGNVPTGRVKYGWEDIAKCVVRK